MPVLSLVMVCLLAVGSCPMVSFCVSWLVLSILWSILFLFDSLDGNSFVAKGKNSSSV